MTDLKPCPFCKSDDIEVDCDPYGNWYVICNGGCRADVERNSVRIAERFSKNDAINVWNTRPREAQLEAEIAKLHAQITDPRTVTMTRTRYEEYQAAEERLAAYEGKLTAAEMRERCAVEAETCDNPYGCSTQEQDEACSDMAHRVAAAIRALPDTKE